MSYTVPDIEPTVAAAGEDWHWTRTFDEFPNSEGWTLKYYFRGVGTLDITATALAGSDSAFDVSAPAASTGALAAGRYVWDAIVSLASGETHRAATGVLTVTPKLASAAAGAQQTHNEKMLALIETELENRLTGISAGGAGSVETYTIHGRSLAKLTTPELKKLRGQYLAAVQRERSPGGIGTPVGVTFGPVQ